MKNNCEHEYEAGMVLAGKLNCKKCGLLKSTIESEVKPEGVGEWEERFNEEFTSRRNLKEFQQPNIMDDYLLLPGTNSVPAPNQIKSFISTLLLQEKAKWIKEWTLTDEQLDLERVIDNQNEVIKELSDNFEKRLEEYRNSPEVWKNVGVSKWKNWGVANGYFEFFKAKWKGEIEKMGVRLSNLEGQPGALEFTVAYNQAILDILTLIDKL